MYNSQLYSSHIKIYLNSENIHPWQFKYLHLSKPYSCNLKDTSSDFPQSWDILKCYSIFKGTITILKVPHFPTSGYLKWVDKKDMDTLFSRACSNRTRSDGLKLKEGRFRLDIMIFFMMKVVKHWSRLPREAIDDPPLKTLKVKLDRALNKLI